MGWDVLVYWILHTQPYLQNFTSVCLSCSIRRNAVLIRMKLGMNPWEWLRDSLNIINGITGAVGFFLRIYISYMCMFVSFLALIQQFMANESSLIRR